MNKMINKPLNQHDLYGRLVLYDEDYPTKLNHEQILEVKIKKSHFATTWNDELVFLEEGYRFPVYAVRYLEVPQRYSTKKANIFIMSMPCDLSLDGYATFKDVVFNITDMVELISITDGIQKLSYYKAKARFEDATEFIEGANIL
mgnify:CR=1 FL=1